MQHLGEFRSAWERYSGASGSVWQRLRGFGSVLERLGTFERFWERMREFGRFESLGAFERVWKSLGALGVQRVYIGVHIRSPAIVCTHS